MHVDISSVVKVGDGNVGALCKLRDKTNIHLGESVRVNGKISDRNWLWVLNLYGD